METAVLHYRYPGSRPFQDTDLDRRLFFGREHETQLLLHTVLAERLTVLFAKSGMGKTSLLNAGIMQLLRERNFFPFKVRFNTLDMTPLQTVYESIKRSLHQEKDEYDPQRTLLGYFQTFEFSSLDLWASEETSLTPVLILDQFEEFFTLHAPKSRQAFTHQLAELVKYRAQEIKILISIREDFLGHLEEIAKELPDIFQNRFRISALTREQARKAIEEPARIDNALLSTIRFHYAPEAVATMLDFLCRQRKRGEFILSDEVEPFQLQLLCQYIEQMVRETLEKEVAIITVQQDHLGGEAGMQKILENFYEYQIEQFESKLKKRRVRNLFEYGLLSVTNRRLSLEEEDIEIRFNVTKEMLANLVNNRLIRAERRACGVYYEISHDTLIEGIRNSQKKREVTKIKKASYYFNLGYNFALLKEYDKAIESYTEAIKIDPNNAFAYNELGFLFYEQARYDEAIQFYQQALLFDPEYADTYYNLGKTFFNLKKYDESAEYFKKTIQLDPKNHDAYQCLGDTLLNLGNYDEAFQYYQQAMFI